MKTTKPTHASSDEVQTVITALKELHEQMTFLTPLSPEQRGALRAGRIGPQGWPVLQNRLGAARQHRDMLPPTFDLRKFERDVELAGNLRDCLVRLDQIRAGVNDTLLALGSRVLQASAAVYGYINVASSSEAARSRILRVTRRSRSRGTNPSASTAPTVPVTAAPAAVASPTPEQTPPSAAPSSVQASSPVTPKKDAA